MSRPCPDIRQICECSRVLDWQELADGRRCAVCQCGQVHTDDSNKDHMMERSMQNEHRFPR